MKVTQGCHFNRCSPWRNFFSCFTEGVIAYPEYCTKYRKNIVSGYEEQDSEVDLEIECRDGRILKAHKRLLASRSSVFEAMLLGIGEFSERSSDRIRIPDFHPKSVVLFLGSMYLNGLQFREIENHEDVINLGLDLITLCHKYDVKFENAASSWKRFLLRILEAKTLTAEDCVNILRVSRIYNQGVDRKEPGFYLGSTVKEMQEYFVSKVLQKPDIVKENVEIIVEELKHLTFELRHEEEEVREEEILIESECWLKLIRQTYKHRLPVDLSRAFLHVLKNPELMLQQRWIELCRDFPDVAVDLFKKVKKVESPREKDDEEPPLSARYETRGAIYRDWLSHSSDYSYEYADNDDDDEEEEEENDDDQEQVEQNDDNDND